MTTHYKNFCQRFESYKKPIPIGLKMPEIKIDAKYYSELGIESSVSNAEFLRELCRKGIRELGILNKPNKEEYFERVKLELSVFEEVNFVDYMLLCWDVINFCKESNIPTGLGRGSAAGSLVLYLIGVTGIDSLKYNLFFERFVSKTRAKMIIDEETGEEFFDGSLIADVDSDISYYDRQKVIQYIYSKYPNKTSKILTLNTLSGKLAFKECGKIAAGMAEHEVNEISDTIPKKFGKVAPLFAESEEEDKQGAYQRSEKFKAWANKNPNAFKIALKIENLNKNTGVHPSGIAISYYNLDDVMPTQLTSDGEIVSGYDMHWVQELMVKFDALGLRTLSVVQDCANQLGIDWKKDIDLDDPKIYEPFKDLRLGMGLFQIEAPTNFKVCQKVRPKNLEEMSAVVAIARPGALDYLEQYAKYSNEGIYESQHEFLDDVFGTTGFVSLYQEQLLQALVKIGFTKDEAETVRRVVGKKKVSEMPAWKEKIYNKVRENDLDEKLADIIWKIANDSANYSFNKCILENELVELQSSEKIMIKNVNIGDFVKSYDTKNDKNIYTKVLNVMKNKKKLYEVTLEDGKKIRTSMDHKFLCEDMKMRSLKDIISCKHCIVSS